MRVTVFDYGAGNLHSLVKALDSDSWDIRVEPDPTRATDTDVLVLPGVGAFAAAVQRLAPGLDSMRRALEDGLPCLGICLGMQLLFDQSEEGPGQGLGLLRGRVRRLQADRIPQIGWNSVSDVAEPAIESAELQYAYYANSYVCAPTDPSAVVAWSTHGGDRFPAAVRRGAILGVQFHPEKSSQPGVRMLHEFLKAQKP